MIQVKNQSELYEQQIEVLKKENVKQVYQGASYSQHSTSIDPS
jgi:hypothetical protein